MVKQSKQAKIVYEKSFMNQEGYAIYGLMGDTWELSTFYPLQDNKVHYGLIIECQRLQDLGYTIDFTKF